MFAVYVLNETAIDSYRIEYNYFKLKIPTIHRFMWINVIETDRREIF